MDKPFLETEKEDLEIVYGLVGTEFLKVNKKLIKGLNGKPGTAIFLSLLIERHKFHYKNKELDREGYFYLTQENITKKVGLSKSIIQSAKKALKKYGIIKIKNKGIENKGCSPAPHYLINFPLVKQILIYGDSIDLKNQIPSERKPVGCPKENPSDVRKKTHRTSINKNLKIRTKYKTSSPISSKSAEEEDSPSMNISSGNSSMEKYPPVSSVENSSKNSSGFRRTTAPGANRRTKPESKKPSKGLVPDEAIVKITTPKNKKPSYKKLRKEEFEKFYSYYPKKKGKGSAKTAWDKLCNKSPKDVPTLQELLKALSKQSKTKQWKDKTYIPYPATWLNQSRWLDEIEPMNENWMGKESKTNERRNKNSNIPHPVETSKEQMKEFMKKEKIKL